MTPRTLLDPARLASVAARLAKGNADFARRYSGESTRRQPVHTVYGGAQVFGSDTASKLGALAIRSLADFAPTPDEFGRKAPRQLRRHASQGDRSRTGRRLGRPLRSSGTGARLAGRGRCDSR